MVSKQMAKTLKTGKYRLGERKAFLSLPIIINASVLWRTVKWQSAGLEWLSSLLRSRGWVPSYDEERNGDQLANARQF